MMTWLWSCNKRLVLCQWWKDGKPLKWAKDFPDSRFNAEKYLECLYLQQGMITWTCIHLGHDLDCATLLNDEQWSQESSFYIVEASLQV
jgi:hypothetical protein